ncbi:hypothetical protein T11_16079 [Trichinella zimbabwensis]|uniref:Uncharacterized protein n=1 Tax=Trichinella zimbabwensis TaxID=268475 RepID=A0A0V1H241_9BILA|nr:hypothetical protein T11_16079 [Trichinella zimbabwensis]
MATIFKSCEICLLKKLQKNISSSSSSRSSSSSLTLQKGKVELAENLSRNYFGNKIEYANFVSYQWEAGQCPFIESIYLLSSSNDLLFCWLFGHSFVSIKRGKDGMGWGFRVWIMNKKVKVQHASQRGETDKLVVVLFECYSLDDASLSSFYLITESLLSSTHVDDTIIVGLLFCFITSMLLAGCRKVGTIVTAVNVSVAKIAVTIVNVTLINFFPSSIIIFIIVSSISAFSFFKRCAACDFCSCFGRGLLANCQIVANHHLLRSSFPNFNLFIKSYSAASFAIA